MSEVEISERYIAEINATIREAGMPALEQDPAGDRDDSEIIAFIAGLVDRGAAYVADGDVYFDIRESRGYGILSGQSANNLISGARIDPGEKKRSRLISPCGNGRRRDGGGRRRGAKAGPAGIPSAS